ncbi:hypothetical protein HK104_000085, partial [Borealophlyctis nickersoniae]
IGQKMAMVELKVMLIRFVQRWRMELVEGQEKELEWPVDNITSGFKRAITVIIVATTSAVIGSLTFSGWNKSIDEVTLNLRDLALATVYENVDSTLRSVEDVAKVLGSDPSIRDLLEEMNVNQTALYRDHPKELTALWTMTQMYPHLATAGLATNFPVSRNYQYHPNFTMVHAYHTGGFFFFQDSSTYNATRDGNSYYILPVNKTGWKEDRSLSFIGNGIPYIPDNSEKVDFNLTDNVGRGWWQTAKYGGYLYPLSWFVWKGLPVTAAKSGEDPLGAIQLSISARKLDAFMAKIFVSENAVISLWQSDGEMVASSVPNTTYVPTTDLRNIQHYTAENTTQPLIRETAHHLLTRFGSYNAIPDSLHSTFTSPTHGTILVNVRLITNYTNLKWILVLCVPAEDFIGTLSSTQTSVIGAVSGTAVGMVVLSAIIAYALVYPIRRLTATMVQATAFDFSAIRGGYLTQKSVWEPMEIAECKGVFNTMLTRFAGAIQANKNLMQRATTSSLPGTQTGNGTGGKEVREMRADLRETRV